MKSYRKEKLIFENLNLDVDIEDCFYNAINRIHNYATEECLIIENRPEKKCEIIFGNRKISFDLFFYAEKWCDDNNCVDLEFMGYDGRLFSITFKNITELFHFSEKTKVFFKQMVVFNRLFQILRTIHIEGINIFTLNNSTVGRLSEVSFGIRNNYGEGGYVFYNDEGRILDHTLPINKSLKILRRNLKRDYSLLEREKISLHLEKEFVLLKFIVGLL